MGRRRLGGWRGEIRWYTFRLPDKRRPVLILTRNDVIDRLNEIIVAPATRTIRGLNTEVFLTIDDGMPAACALNLDHVSLAQRSRIGPVLCNRVRFRKIKRLKLLGTHGPGIIALTWGTSGVRTTAALLQFGDVADGTWPYHFRFAI